MNELREAVTSVGNLLWVLGVFGIAPRLALRLIVHAYPPDHPRRQELKAEVNAVPWIERPLWVAEQLEVALFDGLRHRISAALRQLSDRRRAPEQTGDEPEMQPRHDEFARRRELLAHCDASAFGIGVMDAAPSHIEMIDVKQVEAALRAMRALDYQFDRGPDRDALLAQLSWAQRLQSASCQEEVRQRLLRALGELENLARGRQT